jgi:hypothetical protein
MSKIYQKIAGAQESQGLKREIALPTTYRCPSSSLTATPIEAATDWLRLPKPGHTLYGMGRTFLYMLCKRGKIRSVVLRQRHNQRGIRLLWRPAIEAFLAAEDRAQNGA